MRYTVVLGYNHIVHHVDPDEFFSRTVEAGSVEEAVGRVAAECVVQNAADCSDEGEPLSRDDLLSAGALIPVYVHEGDPIDCRPENWGDRQSMAVIDLTVQREIARRLAEHNKRVSGD
ncbi:hypothetical protein JMJ55_04630 [Belnapia sp. T6]|uniref:Uncharacterized protein n=1 Tax=Belnapia mucosa TaxID=2804532 RepID=A0ABS1UYQ4_9PROT|nr:hypothetical protein [Belnapia mucosa]MBL6454599.1 hypothetical protein [Belnapia mucosa]